VTAMQRSERAGRRGEDSTGLIRGLVGEKLGWKRRGGMPGEDLASGRKGKGWEKMSLTLYAASRTAIPCLGRGVSDQGVDMVACDGCV